MYYLYVPGSVVSQLGWRTSVSGDGGELENSNVPLGKEIRQLNDLTNEEQNEWNHVKHEISC